MKRLVWIALLAALLAACGQQEASTDTAKVKQPTMVAATVLQFQEQEEGVTPYPLRMLVTREFLRMDDGADAKSYLLYDRAQQTILNVNADDKTVLVISRKSLKLPVGSKPEMDVRDNDTSDMPRLGSQQPVHKTLQTQGKRCYDVVAVPGMLPDVVAAMREYLLTLSSQQIENLDKTPVEMRNPCMMANLIYYPDKHLGYGFPLREWDYRGFVRELVGFEQRQMSDDLFTVADQYQRITLDRSGMKRE